MLNYRCCFAVALCSTMAIAGPPEDEHQGHQIEKITVRGSKMSVSLSEFTTSASVITGDKIKNTRIEKLSDIESLVPNLKFSELGEVGARFISIRGIGVNPLSENRVAVYIDDVPFRTINNKLLLDVSQIEVLRGPQGTLYGANTEGGVIVINTRLPDGEAEVDAQMTSEHYRQGDRQQVLFTASGSLTDNWSGRFAAVREQGDAFTKNIDPNTSNRGELADTAVLATLNYYLNSQFSATLQYAGEYNRANGIYEQTYIPMHSELYNQIFAQPNPSLAQIWGIAQINQRAIGRKHEYHMDGRRMFDVDEHAFNLKIAYQWDEYELVSVSSFLDKHSLGYGAQFELTSLPIINTGSNDDKQQIFQEIRLRANTSDQFTWLLGTSGYRGKRDFAVEYKDILGGQKHFVALAPLEEVSTDLAIFAHATYDFSMGFSTTLGARWETAKREMLRSKTEAFFVGGQPSAAFPKLDESVSHSMFLPKIAFAYEWSEQVNSYISAAKGWQPGGVNDDAFLTQQDREKGQYYAPESLWNYEIGIRGLSADERFSWSAAVFLSRAKDWHEMNFLRNERGEAVSTSIIINAAKINSHGVELEVKWRANDALFISAGFGYTDSEYKDFDLDSNVSFTGNRSIMMPKYSANLVADYQLTDDLHFNLKWVAYGDMMLDLTNQVSQKSIHVVDANLSWNAEPYELTLFAENLFDQYYFNGQAFQDFIMPFEGVHFSSPAAPRRIGLSFSYRF